jgi:hypothetical protein
VNSIKGDSAGGITFGYTPYSGGGESGVADLKGAPIPDFPGIAYNYGNNPQGYQQLAGTYQAVGTVKGIGLFYGASAVGALGVLGGPVLPEAGQEAVAFLESRGVPECSPGQGAMGSLETSATLSNKNLSHPWRTASSRVQRIKGNRPERCQVSLHIH